MTDILEKRQSLHKRLAEQKRLNGQLVSEVRQMRSLAGIGMISAMAAHEMNNVLMPLGNYAQLAIDNPDDTDLLWKTIRKTALNSQRAGKILESLLAMADGRTGEKKQHRLKDILEEVFGVIVRDFGKDNIRVNIQIPENLMVWGDGISLQQLLMNLILNAREAMMPTGGTLTICADRLDDFVRIKVGDTGCGIKAENLKKVFEPFYTTKTKDSASRRAGTGLGLGLCKKVVQAHAGTISVQSRPGEGTAFEVKLPNMNLRG